MIAEEGAGIFAGDRVHDSLSVHPAHRDSFSDDMERPRTPLPHTDKISSNLYAELSNAAEKGDSIYNSLRHRDKIVSTSAKAAPSTMASPYLQQRTTPMPTTSVVKRQSRGLEDSLASDGPGSCEASLHISMLSPSMANTSAMGVSGLMITMGKMLKKEGHGLMAKERPVECWIEENSFKVKGEGDAMAEAWDLAQCTVVPPHKLDRLKLRMLSGKSGLRELSLHAHSKLEAQQWLRALVSRQEIIRVQSECNGILTRAQEAHEQKQRQLSQQIEILTRSSGAWEEECSNLTQQMGELLALTAPSGELLALTEHKQREHQELLSQHQDLLSQHQACKEQIREQQEKLSLLQLRAAYADDVDAQMAELKLATKAQVEELVRTYEHQSVNQDETHLLAACAEEAVTHRLQSCMAIVEHLQITVHEGQAAAAAAAAELARDRQPQPQQQQVDAEGVCRIQLLPEEWEAMLARMREQEKLLEEQEKRLHVLADVDAAVRRDCLHSIMLVQEMQQRFNKTDALTKTLSLSS